MSNPLQFNSHLRLAESIAALLSEGPPMSVKAITRELRRRGTFRGKANSISKALADAGDFYQFVRLPDDRWAISDNPISN